MEVSIPSRQPLSLAATYPRWVETLGRAQRDRTRRAKKRLPAGKGAVGHCCLGEFMRKGGPGADDISEAGGDKTIMTCRGADAPGNVPQEALSTEHLCIAYLFPTPTDHPYLLSDSILPSCRPFGPPARFCRMTVSPPVHTLFLEPPRFAVRGPGRRRSAPT